MIKGKSYMTFFEHPCIAMGCDNTQLFNNDIMLNLEYVNDWVCIKCLEKFYNTLKDTEIENVKQFNEQLISFLGSPITLSDEASEELGIFNKYSQYYKILKSEVR